MAEQPSEDVIALHKQNIQVSEDELIRLEALRRFKLLDTLPESMFDRVTNLARQLFGVPISLVSLVDVDRQWFKSNPGLEGVRETCREHAFCHYTVKPDSPDVFVVLDSTKDPRFQNNPLVCGFPNVIFYAGAGLSVTWKGRVVRIGSLCLIDHKPRTSFSVQEKTQLTQLAAIIVDLIELRDVQDSTSSLREMQKLVLCVAHEFRTPLSGIKLGVNLLQENVATTSHGEFFDTLQQISSSIELMQLLIDQKLGAFGGSVKHEVNPVVVTDLVKKLSEVTKLMVLQVSPVFEIDPACPAMIFADSSMLTQIATQFLSNSCRYTAQGYITFRISRIVHAKVDGLDDPRTISGVRLEVADSGPGVPESILPRIFDAFVKGPVASPGLSNQSLGLGLYCVKQLVNSVQGRCGVYNSEPEPGCVQWAEIPCEFIAISEGPSLKRPLDQSPNTPDITDTPPNTRRRVNPQDPPQATATEKPRALVIEDAPMIRKMMCQILRVCGYEPEEACNGQVGLEMLKRREKPFDVAFVDFVMPVMDGIECVRQYRLWEEEQGLDKQVFLWGVSANAEENDIKTGMKAGLNGFSQKPINTDQIRRVLNSVPTTLIKPEREAHSAT